MKVPRAVAVCPTCRGTLYLEVDEWEEETGIPTDGGCHIHCTRSQHSGASETRMPYVFWLPLQQQVMRWVRVGRAPRWAREGVPPAPQPGDGRGVG